MVVVLDADRLAGARGGPRQDRWRTAESRSLLLPASRVAIVIASRPSFGLLERPPALGSPGRVTWKALIIRLPTCLLAGRDEYNQR